MYNIYIHNYIYICICYTYTQFTHIYIYIVCVRTVWPVHTYTLVPPLFAVENCPV